MALLVNNAGINGYGPFAEVDPGLAQRVLAVNVVTASLEGLTRGEVVCVPGLSEPEAITRLAVAELGVRAAIGPALASRYAGR